MRKPLRSTRRDGAVLPLVTISLIGLLAFVALAIDIGLMAVARTQAQATADVAALAGARTLDGNAGNNRTNAEAEAREAAQANSVLGTPVAAAQITTAQAGVYKYNTTSLRFVTDFVNAPSGLEAYGAMRVVINADQQTYFGRFLGVNSMKVSAVATAVHRPRDMAISLDFSGSMKFSSEFNYPPTVSPTIDITGVLNPDSRFPRFGPWTIYPVATAGNPNPMQRLERYVDSGGETHAVNNLTIETDNGPADRPELPDERLLPRDERLRLQRRPGRGVLQHHQHPGLHPGTGHLEQPVRERLQGRPVAAQVGGQFDEPGRGRLRQERRLNW